MARRIGWGLMGALIGYCVGALGGGWLVSVLSSNQFDREMEAAMTGAFVLGPCVALLGFIIAFLRTKPSTPAP